MANCSIKPAAECVEIPYTVRRQARGLKSGHRTDNRVRGPVNRTMGWSAAYPVYSARCVTGCRSAASAEARTMRTAVELATLATRYNVLRHGFDRARSFPLRLEA